MTRAPREYDTRDEESRTEEWNPVDVLPDPVPSDDYSFRWVRKAIMGETDMINWSRRTREGWIPVTCEEQPMLAEGSESREFIELGGLVLCKMPKQREAARQRYYDNLAEAQLTGLSTNMRNEAKEDHRMPIQEERRTKTSRSPQ